MTRTTSQPPRSDGGPRSSSEDWREPQETITVHEVERRPAWSGLYDASGRRLYRVVDRVPFGFHPPARKVRKRK